MDVTAVPWKPGGVGSSKADTIAASSDSIVTVLARWSITSATHISAAQQEDRDFRDHEIASISLSYSRIN